MRSPRFILATFSDSFREIDSKMGGPVFSHAPMVDDKGEFDFCQRPNLSFRVYQQLSEKLEDNDLTQIYEMAEEYCRDCKLLSPIEEFSPTERRVFNILLNTKGLSVHEISNKVGIALRRAYKYLNKLMEKNLVWRQRKATTYILTSKGKEVADCLEKVCQLFNEKSALPEIIWGKDVKKNE